MSRKGFSRYLMVSIFQFPVLSFTFGVLVSNSALQSRGIDEINLVIIQKSDVVKTINLQQPQVDFGDPERCISICPRNLIKDNKKEAL